MNAIRFHTTIGESGALTLPPDVKLAPGPVEVIVLQETVQATPSLKQAPEPLPQRLARQAREMQLGGLPKDLAENHDHYVHGLPKGLDKE